MMTAMSDHELLLVITICQLLGKSVAPADVLEAHRVAQERLEYYKTQQSR